MISHFAFLFALAILEFIYDFDISVGVVIEFLGLPIAAVDLN